MTLRNQFRLPLLIAVFLLGGCTGSAEDRINAAVPVSKDVESAKAALEGLAKAQTADIAPIEDEYRSRLKVRALECGRGFQPSMLSGQDSIRKAIGNDECFAAADQKLQQWLGLRRIGLLLAMPALRQVPEVPPPLLAAEEGIQNAAFADKAGIAIVQTARAYQVFDLYSGGAIHAGDLESLRPISVSPNGRVFVSGSAFGAEARLRDVESGDVLATLSGVRNSKVFWLDDHGLVYARADAGAPVYFDFASGRETKIPLTVHGVEGVLKVPGSKAIYALLSYDRIGTVELVQDAQGLEPRLTQEVDARGGNGWSQVDIGERSDGRLYFSAGDSLQQLQLATLEMQPIPFQPMRVTRVLQMHDPDQLLVAGDVGGMSAYANLYVYSIAQRSLAKVDRKALLSDRLIYIPVLHRNAVIDGNKIVMLDALPTAEPVAIDSVLDKLSSDTQVAMLVAAERNRALIARYASVSAAPSASASAAPAPASAPAPALPAAGQAGLVEAIRKGVLRPGNSGDVAQWKYRYMATARQSLDRDFDEHIEHESIYVITGDFTIPSGLSGGNAVVFVLGSGVPFPRGDPGHSPILDINTGSCSGMICGMLLSH